MNTNPVSLKMLNQLRFPNCPRPLVSLRRGCRNGRIAGAFKVGHVWYVDLVKFDKAIKNQQEAILNDAMAMVSDQDLEHEVDALFAQNYETSSGH